MNRRYNTTTVVVELEKIRPTETLFINSTSTTNNIHWHNIVLLFYLLLIIMHL